MNKISRKLKQLESKRERLESSKILVDYDYIIDKLKTKRSNTSDIDEVIEINKEIAFQNILYLEKSEELKTVNTCIYKLENL